MAVNVVNNPSGLKLKFDCGKNEEGKAIRKTKTFSNLRHNAGGQDVYDVAVMISSLQDHTLIDIAKVDNSTIAQ